jgi:hypothetical protein
MPVDSEKCAYLASLCMYRLCDTFPSAVLASTTQGSVTLKSTVAANDLYFGPKNSGGTSGSTGWTRAGALGVADVSLKLPSMTSCTCLVCFVVAALLPTNKNQSWP